MAGGAPVPGRHPVRRARRPTGAAGGSVLPPEPEHALSLPPKHRPHRKRRWVAAVGIRRGCVKRLSSELGGVRLRDHAAIRASMPGQHSTKTSRGTDSCALGKGAAHQPCLTCPQVSAKAVQGAGLLAAWAISLCDNVLQPATLQTSYDSAVARPQSSASLSGAEAADLAAMVATNLTQAAPLVLALRDAVTAKWGEEPAPVLGEEGEEVAAASADALTAAGLLREASLQVRPLTLSPSQCRDVRCAVRALGFACDGAVTSTGWSRW